MLSIGRREFITLVGGAAAGWPLAARAQQQPAKIARIGYLGFGTAAASAARVEALRVALRELGYIEGKNIHIEFRWAERIELLHELAPIIRGSRRLAMQAQRISRLTAVDAVGTLATRW